MRTLLLLFAALAATAQPRVTAVGNGADFSAVIAPGSLASVFGTGLAAAAASAPVVPFPATLNGVSVSVGGRAARLSYISPTQINFQVPSNVSLGAATVTVTNGTAVSNAIAVTVNATAPGIFQYGANRGVVQNQDYSLNGATNAATSGSTIIVYLTGIGATNPPVADGAVAPGGPLAIPATAATATIGGAVAPVQFIGLTPGNVGLAQANLQVPNIATGDQPVVITLNGVASRPVQISVKGTQTETSGGGPVTGAPEGLQCVSGTVDSIIMSLQYKTPGLADEIVVGGTRICEKCDVKPPIFVEFVKQLEKTREDGTLVDACYDSAGNVNALQLRR
jgi:uncharacterized protein (TIGR03437 family)